MAKSQDEADEAAKGRQSFLCVILKHEDIAVGLLYSDSREKHEFGADNNTELLHKIENLCKENGFTKVLAEINNDLRGRAL